MNNEKDPTKERRKAGSQPPKDTFFIDIDKAIGPRKSYVSLRQPSFDHFDKKINEHEDEMMPPHWAVPWSDIMMVVFVMFAVLFIYSAAKRDVADAFKTPATMKAMAPKQETAPAMDPEQVRHLSRRLTEGTRPDQVSVAIEKDRPIKVSANESLFFDLGKANIKPDGIEFLRNFAGIIKNMKSNIRIEGHTDSYPIHSPAFPTNWELSAIRAVNIARFLIEETGLEPERFTVVGHSFYRPAVPNSTSENKAKNRRVEIFIDNELLTNENGG
jgi:chemotaxis protein MotB